MGGFIVSPRFILIVGNIRRLFQISNSRLREGDPFGDPFFLLSGKVRVTPVRMYVDLIGKKVVICYYRNMYIYVIKSLVLFIIKSLRTYVCTETFIKIVFVKKL